MTIFKKNVLIFINHFKAANKFIDSIQEIKNLGYYVVCMSNKNINNILSYGDKNIQIDLHDYSKILELCKELKATHIHTSTDFLLPMIARLYSDLKLLNPPCSIKTAEILINKQKFNEFLVNCGFENISIPTLLITKEKDFNKFEGSIFCKPDIGSGARKVDDYDYCEFDNLQMFKQFLIDTNQYEDFIHTNINGKITSHFTLPTKHIIQPFYESANCYAVQVLYKNKEEHLICFYDNFKMPPPKKNNHINFNLEEDPRIRNKQPGVQRSWARAGGMVFPYVPNSKHFDIIQKVRNAVNHIFTELLDVQNLFVTYEITILTNGRAIINDINPRLGGLTVDTCPMMFNGFYNKIWSFLLDSKQTISLKPGKLGLRHIPVLKPGKIKSISLPQDTDDIQILSRNHLEIGKIIPYNQNTVSQKSRIIITDKNHDEEAIISKLLTTITHIQSYITYEE